MELVVEKVRELSSGGIKYVKIKLVRDNVRESQR